MKNPRHCFLYDVDGFLTDDSSELNPDVVDCVAELSLCFPTAFITGRSAHWLQKQVMPTLETALAGRAPNLFRFFAEYGTVELKRSDANTYSLEAEVHPLEDLRNQVTGFLREQVDENPSFCMVHESDKAVVITAVAKFAIDPHEPRNRNQLSRDIKVVGRYMEDLARTHASVVTFEQSTYACDLVPYGSNKGYGAERMLRDYREAYNAFPDEFIVFGDSLGDFRMTEPIKQQRVHFRYYHVGDPERYPAGDGRVHITKQRYDYGTLDTLRMLQKELLL
jgi:HAD superfamily hydrolase (TIGR01484 family)